MLLSYYRRNIIATLCRCETCMYALLTPVIANKKMLTNYCGSALCGLDWIRLQAVFSFTDWIGPDWVLADSDRIGL